MPDICGHCSSTTRENTTWTRSADFPTPSAAASFTIRILGGAIPRVAILSARKGENNDEAAESQHGDDEDAAFRAGGSAAQDGLAYGMRGEKMVLRHHPAVGDAVEERLGPIPRSVEADGPPQRAGPPETEAKEQAGQTRREQPDGRLARILAVTQTEEDGKEDG